MKNKFVVSIISLMGVGMIVKVLGFFRSLLIARQFGSGATTDAFFLALSLIGIFTSFFGGALGQTIVPILTEITYSEGQEAKDRHMSNIVNLFIVGSIAIIGFIWLLAPQIINLMAKDGFTASQVNLTVDLLRIGLPALLFYNITGLYKGYLHTEEIFVISEISNLPYNIIYILYLLALSSLFGIRGLMFAHGIAVFSMLILPIHTIKKRGYHHSLIFKPRDPYIIKSLNMILPVFMGIAINDLNIFIDQLMASRLAVGSISALNYGNRFNIIVQQIFVAALSTVIFPEISKAYQEKDHKSVTNIVQRGMNLVLLVVIPMTIAIMVLHVPVTRLLFERGEFTPLATQMTAKAMFFYSLGLPAASLKVLLLKLSYASMDMKLPLVNSILS
ncbi:MAG TPA: murein biosynthesis integral membrane protein MurJ, partial [Candidatus Eisenbacteria bacterium]|nr:murein biosynthesis integral membrane protein MurJ [Candidatus Eisenbacteria bacterium]